MLDVDRNHPLVWTEQLMPVFPVVRVNNVDEAIDLAVAAEGGRRHTAAMHSHNINKLSRMARLINCSIFIKNGPCYAGLGRRWRRLHVLLDCQPHRGRHDRSGQFQPSTALCYG